MPARANPSGDQMRTAAISPLPASGLPLGRRAPFYRNAAHDRRTPSTATSPPARRHRPVDNRKINRSAVHAIGPQTRDRYLVARQFRSGARRQGRRSSRRIARLRPDRSERHFISQPLRRGSGRRRHLPGSPCLGPGRTKRAATPRAKHRKQTKIQWLTAFLALASLCAPQ